MQLTYQKNFKLVLIVMAILVALLFVVVQPQRVSAQVITFQPQTQGELLAYLYGQLSILLQMQQQGGVTQNSGNSGQNLISPNTQSNSFSISTKGATEIDITQAYLLGEVVLYGEAQASVWFEYGQDEDFLDQKTGKGSVRSAYDRVIRTKVSNLKEDTRYYFRLVAEDKEGKLQYGRVYSFRTEEADE